MSRTTELRQAAVTQANDLLEALDELADHVDQHPGTNGDEKQATIDHARDRAQRSKRGLEDDWPE